MPSPSLYRLNPSPNQKMISRLFELNGDFLFKGVWSGVSDLVALAYQELKEDQQQDLIDQHNYTLYHVLPGLRGEVGLKFGSLTDTSKGSEKTRNFPLDRAYRFVHSLIVLLKHWKSLRDPNHSWAIVVHHFDRTEHLSQRFFLELSRRLKDEYFVFVDAPRAGFKSELSPRPEAALTVSFMERLTDIPWEESFVGTILNLRETDPLLAARNAIKGLTLYNHYGYYYESHAFAPLVRPYLKDLAGNDENQLWSFMGNVYQGFIATGNEEEALRWLLDEVEPKLSRPITLAKFHYVLAITYLRYQKPANIAAAEFGMEQAARLLNLGKDEIEFEDYAFLRVFIGNGLAFVRVRQQRHAEALQLCKDGYDFLTVTLGESRHRLHRSVLLYNSAQVYQSLGQLPEALRFFQMAAEMDPYYSEYHNDIGNILQTLGDYEAALASYQNAITYSAPYAEVFFNKGVCLYHLAQWSEAESSFQEALMLEPSLQDALLLLAEVYEHLGRSRGERLNLYTRALELNPQSVIGRVNRAILHYENEFWEAALDDIGFAIDEEPASAEHLENRAAIYRAMGLYEEARADEQRARNLIVERSHV